MSLHALDPGKEGGLASYILGTVEAHPLPDDEIKLRDLLISRIEPEDTVYLEQVNGFMGRKRPGATMFAFGQSYGFIRGVVLSILKDKEQLIDVMPRVWQEALGLKNTAKLEKAAWKRTLKAEAQRRFPHLKITLSTSDALLILEHALQREGREVHAT